MRQLRILLFGTFFGCIDGNHFGWKGRQMIVNYHNKIRSEIARGEFMTHGNVRQPKGTNMLKMKWNHSLAITAEFYAMTVPTHHSGNRMIGENLYWHWATNPGDLEKFGRIAAVSWIKEFKDLTWDTTILTKRLFDRGVGHATQMVWSNTTQVGCGFSTKPEVHKNTGRPITKISVVCHYWPKGNYLHEPIYIPGPTCSKCGEIWKKCEKNTGLCV